ncbi:hypothetical protein KSP39_PZI001132 [Platanthera zijinensis]|uniref:Uncharacterized protein ycf68 n=1 Tax=Platanthera zijinensis TaxID=2320716 RepID=A0AAP0C2Z2_9ASPA
MLIIQGTLALRTPPEDRWGDSGEIQWRSNFLFTHGIRVIRGGPPRLLSSRESIHPLSVYGQLSLKNRLRFGLNGKMEQLEREAKARSDFQHPRLRSEGDRS